MYIYIFVQFVLKCNSVGFHKKMNQVSCFEFYLSNVNSVKLLSVKCKTLLYEIYKNN